MRVAVLDDYQQVAMRMADWSALPQGTHVEAFSDHLYEEDPLVERLKDYPSKISAFTSEGFSIRSRVYWLTKTKAGIALGLAAALGLLVGAVVTYQTLYAATAASLKEYAVLRALGIPRWRMALTATEKNPPPTPLPPPPMGRPF